MFGHHDRILDVTVHHADRLKDVERFGDNDPYVRLFTDLHHPDKGVRTFVAKDQGKNPKWGQTLSLENIKDDAQYLYLDVMDDEKGADEVIGFAAIPLAQIAQLQPPVFAGTFDIYDEKGKAHGTIYLTMRFRRKNEPATTAVHEGSSQRHGISVVMEDHKKHIKKLIRREHLDDTGKVAAGAAMVAGALHLLHKHSDEDKKKKEAAKAAREV
ncbi:hypothetical protein DFQ27_008866 [Actinomortierella ambigua]|uniref:C2 domain-containing protein n=1 Tax=Actinomortierella ambigua TaxID=1343610 RepID=A0A9P6QIE0_9FUNG|nr:hypothetical protein DFQ26_000400 [Actinomortierella ambigua]KAG0267306.1 hypothetical protein DFQ27_008866 [Actinomortierella ambigua]